jgi:hypothetical protein
MDVLDCDDYLLNVTLNLDLRESLPPFDELIQSLLLDIIILPNWCKVPIRYTHSHGLQRHAQI